MKKTEQSLEKKHRQSDRDILLSDIVVMALPFTRVVFDKFPWLAQFINFSVVGVVNTVLSYLLYAFFLWLSLHHQVANQLAFWITVLNGYLMNRFWVFKRQAAERSPAQTIRYFCVYGFNFLLGIFLLYLYVDVLYLNKYIAPIISMPVTIPLNYCLNRYWVFRRPKEGVEKI